MYISSSIKEQRLIVDAINSEDNSKILEELFHNIKQKSEILFNKEFLPKIISHNEANIRSIIKIIQENGFKDSESEELIYTEKFIEVCSIPIFLPETFIGLLSGEFIVYLYRDGNLQLKHKEIIYCKEEEFVEKKDYYQCKKAMEYDLKRNRFIKSKTSYAVQIQEAFPIDIRSLLNDNKRNTDTKKEDTYLWKLFETYSYLQKDKIFDDNERVKIFQAFSKEYTETFPLRLDRKLNANQKNILTLKTYLFQEMDDNQKKKLYNFSLILKGFTVSIRNRINSIRYFLIMLDMINNVKSNMYKANFDYVLNLCLGYLNEICRLNMHRIKHDLKKSNIISPIIIENQENLYLTLLYIIIIYETLRDMEERENRFKIEFAESGNSNNSQIFWNLNFTNQAILSNWNGFYFTQKNTLKQLLGEKDESEYKKLWLMSLNVLLHCYPDRVDTNLSNDYTKRIDDTWLSANNVNLGKFHMTELYALMCVIDKVDKVEASLEGRNSKIYISLKEITACRKPLKSVLKNINTHKRPELEMLITYLITEQHDSFLGNHRIIKCIRELHEIIRLGIHTLTYINPQSKIEIAEAIIEEYHNMLAETSLEMYMSITPEYNKYMSVTHNNHIDYIHSLLPNYDK